MFRRFQEYLWQPVDGASLAAWRIMLGVILVYDAWHNLFLDLTQYRADMFHFKYFGFEWVQAIEPLMPVVAVLLLLGSLCVLLGVFYRPAMITTFVLLAYVFLLRQEDYQNHLYLLLLYCFLMCFVPADRVWSLSAWWRRRQGRPDNNDQQENDETPAWPIFLLRMQTEIMLVYAGLVKITPDWLQLMPLRVWMIENAKGMWFHRLTFFYEFNAIAAYGVIALHLIGAPLLFVKRARIWVFGLYCLFHLMNHLHFSIDIFPFMTVAATLLFFDHDWPRRVWNTVVVWVQGAGLRLFGPSFARPSFQSSLYPGRRRARWVAGLIALWITVQVLVPLRYLLYPNPSQVAWTDFGHFFAWRMMLRHKEAYDLAFVVHWPERDLAVFVNPSDYLTSWQCMRMSVYPDMAVQFAHHLDALGRVTYPGSDPRVHAYIPVSLNYRKARPIIDPAVDLSAAERRLGPVDWVTTLDEPLRSTEEWVKAGREEFPGYQSIAQSMGIDPATTRLARPNYATLHPQGKFRCHRVGCYDPAKLAPAQKLAVPEGDGITYRSPTVQVAE